MQRRQLLVRFGLAGLFLYAVVFSAQESREASLAVTIVDAATGRPTPARVRLAGAGNILPRTRGALAVSETAIPVPRQALAVMWGQQDRAEGYALQPDGSFYVDGAFDLRVPPGPYTLTVSKGDEYRTKTLPLTLNPAASARGEIRLERWIDMPSRGWYSADDHIHLRRSPADDANILRWVEAEGIHVGNLLQMGDFWATYFGQYAFGPAGRYQQGDRILSPGQEEPRTPEIGHTISLGASQFVRNTRDYYSFDRLFDRVHSLGGITGFAHQAMSFHGYRGMTLNVLRGKVDFLELAQFCVPEGPIALDHYYPFLDLGFKLTALAGSDFPWCGRGLPRIGNARFYTYTGTPFSFDKWFEGVKAGHTFVSTGPVVLLTVNGKIPGDTVDIARGNKVTVSVEALGDRAQAPLRAVEIVGHTKVLAVTQAGNAERLTASAELTPERGLWIAARAYGAEGQIAHTTPVYVTVNGGGFHNPETLGKNLDRLESYLQELENELASPGNAVDAQASRHRAELERQIVEARAKLKSLSETLR